MTTIIFYAALAVISLVFFIAGFQKLTAKEPMKTRMEEMNNGGAVMRIIGFLEIIGVVALWLPSLRPLALVSLLPLAVGGLAAHVVLRHDFKERNIPAVLMIVLIVTALVLDPSFSVVFHQI